MIREEILQLLRSDQAFREEVRRQLLTEDLLALPARFDQLTELVREVVEAVHNLTAAQHRTEEAVRRQGEQIERNSEQIRALIEAQHRTEEAVRRQGEQIERNSEQIRALIEAQHRTEEAVRRQGEQIEQNSEQIRALIEAQQRTNVAIQNLTEAQQRTNVAIQNLTEAQQRMEDALRETQLELRELVTWQRGEAGRRGGEQYEREIIRRAFVLFNGGQGGSPDQVVVQQQLSEWLKPLLSQALIDLKPEQDPFLADLIWWKKERVAVVEVSAQVNGYDVYRAMNRAETLRQAGVQAFPVVIGKDWANEESRYQADIERVEWKVGSDLSDGFLAFRQAAST